MHDGKVRRNDPCPCGSGKKYKRCHGALAPEAESGISAAIRIHSTPEGKAVPVIGWAPINEGAWDTIHEQLKLAEQHRLLVPMDTPDHCEAEGVGIRIRQLGPGIPQWSVQMELRPPESLDQRQRIELAGAAESLRLWTQEWKVSISAAEVLRWVEALEGWKAVVIAPYDPMSKEFLPFGFQIWVPLRNIAVQPWEQLG